MFLDHWVANLLAPLGFWVLLNAIDDLIIDAAAALAWLRHRPPSEEDLDKPPPRSMAVFVALWQEHRVIQSMLDNNVTRVQYPRVEHYTGWQRIVKDRYRRLLYKGLQGEKRKIASKVTV